MMVLALVRDYLLWHYSQAFAELWHVWRNFLWFVVHVFSLPVLIMSWLAPFKRITERRGDTWNLEDLAGWIVIGVLSRIIGALIRTVLILIGTACLLLVLGLGVAVYVGWVIAPVGVISLVVSGIALLFV